MAEAFEVTFKQLEQRREQRVVRAGRKRTAVRREVRTTWPKWGWWMPHK